MARTNQFQALKAIASYPVIPAFWPNRSVRRAVQKNQTDRIPKCWLDAFFKFPNLREAVRGLAS